MSEGHSPVIVRRAAPPDFPAIEHLPLREWAAVGRHQQLARYVFVAEADGALVGVAGLEPCGDAALLRSVAVDAKRRGEG
jgi:N-acetylglutamate synthase-like GNAT family acetyltransferase